MKAWKAILADGISAAYGHLRPLGDAAGCRVLMYHALGTKVDGDKLRVYSIEPARFRQQMDCLTALGRERIVGLDAGIEACAGLVITFDDGYRDTLTVAAPLLVELGFPFSVFVAPGLVRSRDQRYLSENELRELSSLPGVNIGAHGDSHCRLTDCDDRKLSNELSYSRAWLEDVLARPVTTMSYPHGAVDGRVRSAAAAAGYSLAACSRFGAHPSGGDPLLIARTDIWAQDDVTRFNAKLAGRWDWMKWRT